MNLRSWSDAALGVAALCVASAAVVYVRNARSPEQPNESGPASRTIANPEQYARYGHMLGRADATVRLVVFSDVQCPFCRKFDKTLSELQLRHPEVGVIYRHYPLEMHYSAFSGAVAAECAGQQGRFAAFIHLVFAKQDSIGLVPFGEFARRAGVTDSVRFERCSADSATRRAVKRDIAAGDALALSGTPSVIVRGRLFDGALPLDSLESVLRVQKDEGNK
jgi:protein-disulfide isomerase